MSPVMQANIIATLSVALLGVYVAIKLRKEKGEEVLFNWLRVVKK